MSTAEQEAFRRVVDKALEIPLGFSASIGETLKPWREAAADLMQAGQEVTGAFQQTADTINNAVGWQNPQELLVSVPGESLTDKRLRALQKKIQFIKVDSQTLVSLETTAATYGYGIVRTLQFQGQALQAKPGQPVQIEDKPVGITRREFLARTTGIGLGIVLVTVLVNSWDKVENTFGLKGKNAATAAERDIRSLSLDELKDQLSTNPQYGLFGFYKDNHKQVFGVANKKDGWISFALLENQEIKWFNLQINDEKKFGFVAGVDQDGRTQVIAIDKEEHRFGFNLGENPQAGFLSFYHLLENYQIQEVGHAYFLVKLVEDEKGDRQVFEEYLTDYPDIKINPDGSISGSPDQRDKIANKIAKKTSTPTASPSPKPTATVTLSATATEKPKPTATPTRKPAVSPSPSPSKPSLNATDSITIDLKEAKQEKDKLVSIKLVEINGRRNIPFMIPAKTEIDVINIEGGSHDDYDMFFYAKDGLNTEDFRLLKKATGTAGRGVDFNGQQQEKHWSGGHPGEWLMVINPKRLTQELKLRVRITYYGTICPGGQSYFEYTPAWSKGDFWHPCE